MSSHILYNKERIRNVDVLKIIHIGKKVLDVLEKEHVIKILVISETATYSVIQQIKEEEVNAHTPINYGL